jgi:uncharacterized membrane protein|tara:strand:+ start:955 stop:1305 length:351 start_codon:yes stop_codon:yes gene_type:complete
MNEVTQSKKPSKDTAKLVYILYLVGLVFGITGIVGVVMAYINKDDAPDWLKTHYQFQIRTFWIGAFYMFLGTLLFVILIGWFIFLFWVIWLIVRSVKGMKALDEERPVENPTSWFF